jgi:hypothetical protein
VDLKTNLLSLVFQRSDILFNNLGSVSDDLLNGQFSSSDSFFGSLNQSLALTLQCLSQHLSSLS